LPGLPVPLPGIFLLLSAFIQIVVSKMAMPDVKIAEQAAKKTKDKADDLAAVMQEQMLYILPLSTVIIGYNFPLILILYWGSLSLFQAIQQYFVSGWGGLTPWLLKLNLLKYR
jgi:YidC/Oxa1 family membrane protein insertase